MCVCGFVSLSMSESMPVYAKSMHTSMSMSTSTSLWAPLNKSSEPAGEEESPMAVSEDVAALPEALRESVTSVVLVCGALACLLSPMPLDEHLRANARSVQQVMKCNGRNKTLTLLKTILKEEYWSGLWTDLLSKGSATLEAKPKVLQAIKALEEENCGAETLATILKQYTGWKGQLRAGALAGLEAQLALRGKAVGDQILKDQAQATTSSQMEAVLQVLQLSNPPPAEFLALAGKLQKLRNTQSKAMAIAEMKVGLQGLPSQSSAAPRLWNS